MAPVSFSSKLVSAVNRTYCCSLMRLEVEANHGLVFQDLELKMERVLETNTLTCTQQDVSFRMNMFT